MRKQCGIALVALSAWFGSSEAAYVIRLKNGNEYVTTRYWQEGGQVLFDTYGGVFGIERTFVARIETTERTVKLAADLDRDFSEKAQSESKKDADEEGKLKVNVTPKKEKAPDDPIVGEFNRLKEMSKQVDGMLTSEIHDLLMKIVTFKNKLSKDRVLSRDYSREFNDIHEVSSFVEDALRERNR